jgi:hypothetical protein
VPAVDKQVPGRSIEVNGGEGDGSTFFMCEELIVADAMDAVTSRPMRVLEDNSQRVFAYWTFLGRDPVTLESKGVTLIMLLDMVRAMAPAARKLFTGVPIELRTVGGTPSLTGMPRLEG